MGEFVGFSCDNDVAGAPCVLNAGHEGRCQSRRLQRLERARADEDEARTKYEASRKDSFDFIEFASAVRERERAMHDAHDCYGDDCISCGCSKGRPCVSHRGSQIYTNELLKQIAERREA